MTHSHPLQRPQSPTQTEGHVLRHSQADDYVRFLCAVAMLRNGCERDTDEPFLVEQLGEQVYVQRLDSIIKDDQPIIPIFYLADGPWHQFSISARVA